jgi:hypothetical protein
VQYPVIFFLAIRNQHQRSNHAVTMLLRHSLHTKYKGFSRIIVHTQTNAVKKQKKESNHTVIIPIDNNVIVPLQNPKDAAKKLNDIINIFTDPKRINHARDVIINSALDTYSDISSMEHYVKAMAHGLNRYEYALKSNNYTYLTSDVCDMIAETQKSLKSWNIHDLHITPGTNGAIIFEKPNHQTFIEKQIGKQQVLDYTNVVGVLWCYEDNVTIGDTSQKANMLWIGLMLDSSDKTSNKIEYGFGSNQIVYKIEKDDSLTPFWNYDDDIEGNEAILNYFAATMMLMQQREIIAEPTTYTPTVKHGKRRDPVLIPTNTNDKGDTVTQEPMRISTVSLSETVRTAYSKNNTNASQKPTKAWWVKGHWRRQAHGPQHSLRKLIYIHPHISGNTEAPLDKRKTMTRVVP